MRALLPDPGPVDLHQHYSHGWVEHGGVRVNFVQSIDGAVSAGGLSAGLQTPGDNQVFAALRDLADVVLVGAGTAVAERYRPIVVSPPRALIRARYRIESRPPVAVVSRSLRVDPGADLFAAGAGARPLLFTCRASAASPVRARLAEVAEVIDCGDDEVELGVVLARLRERNLTRILCEGGPTLFAQLAGAGLVDEVCLTQSPKLIGPGPGRITAGPAWDRVAEPRLAGLLEEDGALFLRYRFG